MTEAPLCGFDLGLAAFQSAITIRAVNESLLWARLITPSCQAVMFLTCALVACDASAADLPSQPQATQSASAAPATNPCFASVYDFLSADPDDCPLAWNGIRLYGRFDYGEGYDAQGLPFNGN
jgi:hypothetical protein